MKNGEERVRIKSGGGRVLEVKGGKEEREKGVTAGELEHIAGFRGFGAASGNCRRR
ncbi:hypothetical protein JZ751_022883 [Albula glossodonta]|uniref:Uncharacterized protein n=1 Tax=Albula glossodonta TaxID=121402 RepID=A0A8T2PMG8_9TELE|nr:hypothetical protein JZ751_022883 [Albula glossodonta]